MVPKSLVVVIEHELNVILYLLIWDAVLVRREHF